MQFKLHHALMAMGALLVTSCTSDGPVNPVNENNTKQETLGFAVNHKNMTKADFKEVFSDFSVWGSNDYVDTPDLIFKNYKVALDGTDWKYDGVLEGQELKYWDSRADNYFFWACAPYNVNNTYDKDKGVITCPWTAQFIDNTDPDAKPAVVAGAASTIEYLLFGEDVILNFKRMNGMLNIKFWEDLVNYTVEVTDCKIVETNYYESADLQFFGATSTSGVKDGATTVQTALGFDAPTGVIGTSRETASLCPKTYFFVPFNTKRPVTVQVTYTITNPTTSVSRTFTDKKTVLANDLAWNGNTAYTYYIRFTKNGNHTPDDGAKPIKFGNPTLDDYQNAEGDFDIVITNLNI